MPDTLDSFILDDDWQSVEELTDGAIIAGQGCLIQNQSSAPIWAAISSTKPEQSFRGWFIPASIDRPMIISAGENQVWLKPTSKNVKSIINIQLDGGV